MTGRAATGALRRRLDRVADRLEAEAACRACLGWGPSTYCDERGRCLRPETCPECGRRVPITRPKTVAGLDPDRL